MFAVANLAADNDVVDLPQDVDDIDFNANNISKGKRKTVYHTNFQHLCPHKPPPSMIKCEENYNLAQYVNETLTGSAALEYK